mmetsp:Transcript_5561/g.23109  ORF Transcript_5561/g.23109 Transcript_5561/m.23109 type:complete len:249 (+) Transcript_5561:2068-2814(+)
MSETKPIPPRTWMAWCAQNVAASEAHSLAIAACFEYGSPASLAAAARHVSNRAASSRQAISESLSWMAYKDAIGLPNAVRSPAYLAATSKEACAMPRAWAAMPMRPASRAFIAILKPSPSRPRICVDGTRTSSRMRFAVVDALMPSLSSGAPNEKPGLEVSTTKHVMPLCLSALSVVANTTAPDATMEFVVHALVPFKIQESSPSRRAVIEAAAASDPFAGSESPKQPTLAPRAYGSRKVWKKDAGSG